MTDTPPPIYLPHMRLSHAALSLDLAVLPWGATEAHNRHLPYGTDTIQAEAIARESARKAAGLETHVGVLPPIPFGVNTQQMDIPLTINMNPSTQRLMLDDIVASLEAAKVPRLVVLNGHGGNDFKWMVRELQPMTPVYLVVVNWYTFLDPAPWFEEPGDHAGEMETSLIMHLAPDLAAPLDEAGPGIERAFRVQAMHEGRAWAPREWTKVTDDTGVGNPSRSTAEKGAGFFEALTSELATFYADLAGTDPADMYE